jgi:hypothetical protein
MTDQNVSRRDVLKLGVLGALAGLFLPEGIAEAAAGDEKILGGVLFEEPEGSPYPYTYGVKACVAHFPGICNALVTDITLRIEDIKDIADNSVGYRVAGMAWRMIGLFTNMSKALHIYGDMHNAKGRQLVLGLPFKDREEKKWIVLEDVVIDMIGVSVSAKADDGQHLMISENVGFKCRAIENHDPIPKSESTKCFEISDEEMKIYVPTWPEISR